MSREPNLCPDIREEHHPEAPDGYELPPHPPLRASSTPFTAPASNAFPSASNSSTLSESARSTLDKFWISPDCSPPNGREISDSTGLLLSTPFSPMVFRPFLVLGSRFGFVLTVIKEVHHLEIVGYLSIREQLRFHDIELREQHDLFVPDSSSRARLSSCQGND